MIDDDGPAKGAAMARMLMLYSPWSIMFSWPWFVCPRLAYWIGVRVGRLLFPRED